MAPTDETGGWNDDELVRIGAADELQLASRRDDGSQSPALRDHVGRPRRRRHLRSVSPGTGEPVVSTCDWSRSGRVRAGGIERDVTFAQTSADNGASIDTAYHDKYDHYGPRLVGAVTGPGSHEITIRLLPA